MFEPSIRHENGERKPQVFFGQSAMARRSAKGADITGSPTPTKMIGIVLVNFFAVAAAGVVLV